MTRGSFLRSLFVVGISPKIIGELDLTPIIKPNPYQSILNYANTNFELTEYTMHCSLEFKNKFDELITDLYKKKLKN